MGLPKDCGLELHHKWKSGKLNKITDVKGLKVASVTIQDNEINTGVTVILPHEGNIFRSKVVAGASVLNGFGNNDKYLVRRRGCDCFDKVLPRAK